MWRHPNEVWQNVITQKVQNIVMKYNCLFHLAVHLRCLNVITKSQNGPAHECSRGRVTSPRNLLTKLNYGTSLDRAFSELLFHITIIIV